jgi:hypothetical protein
MRKTKERILVPAPIEHGPHRDGPAVVAEYNRALAVSSRLAGKPNIARSFEERARKMATKRKKPRTAAQKRATAALVRANKARKGKKKSSKKRASKKRTTKKKTGARKAKRVTRSAVAKEVKDVLDQAAVMGKRQYEKGFKDGKAAAKKTTRKPSRKKATKKRAGKKRASKKTARGGGPFGSGRVPKNITAAAIIGGSKKSSAANQFWVCAGKKRTGCGGGKQGGHVVTKKGSFQRLRP